MTTAYICGCYSDYRISAVFSTRERAEAHAAGLKASGHGDVEVEEWAVDDAAETARRVQTEWRVRVHVGSGFMEVESARTVFAAGTPSKVIIENMPSGPYVIATSCESQAHAEKLAVEGRQRWQAEAKLKWQAHR